MQAPASFLVNGTQYMVALITDSTKPLGYAFVGNTNLSSPPYFYEPAKPGQAIVAYGLGFGPVTPANASGVITTAANSINGPVTFAFGSTPATVSYFGLAPGFVGLYQFNLTVPSTLANGDYPITVTVGGTPIAQKIIAQAPFTISGWSSRLVGGCGPMARPTVEIPHADAWGRRVVGKNSTYGQRTTNS